MSSNFNTSVNPNKHQGTCLIISHKYVSTLLDFLVQEKIGFFITFNNPYSEVITTSEACLNHDKTLDRYIDTKKDIITIFDEIYKTFIVDNIASPPPSDKEIALKYNIHHATLKYYFKKHFGKTFYQLYMQKKMEHAASLLQNGFNCTQVSNMIGYSPNSSIKFNKIFQKYYGVTPKNYQKKATFSV